VRSEIFTDQKIRAGDIFNTHFNCLNKQKHLEKLRASPTG
jgi:hypothetical protein